MSDSTGNGKLPDPYNLPGLYLHARADQLRQGLREMAEAQVFAAAALLRKQWPAAHRVVFDRTETDRNASRAMRFLRVEDRDGQVLATPGNVPRGLLSTDHGMTGAINHLISAESFVAKADGGLGEQRTWALELTSSVERGAQPRYYCAFTLPPLTRPHGDQTALPPAIVRMGQAEIRRYGLVVEDGGAISDTYVTEVFGINVVVREETSAAFGDTVVSLHVQNEGRPEGARVLIEVADGGTVTHRI
jgi:hypothetical protein